MNSQFKSIDGLAKAINELHHRAVQEYTPVINNILCAHNRDPQHIERTLDGLLDFCGYQPVFLLYKKLCRHYFDIDPIATADYINTYREIWESTN